MARKVQKGWSIRAGGEVERGEDGCRGMKGSSQGAVVDVNVDGDGNGDEVSRRVGWAMDETGQKHRRWHPRQAQLCLAKSYCSAWFGAW